MDKKEIKTLAPKLASSLEWDGSLIMDLFQLVLEDANFHTLNGELDALRDKHKI